MAINPNTTFVAGNILTAAQQNRLPFGVCANAEGTANYTLTTTLTIATGMSVTFLPIANRLYKITYQEPFAELPSAVGGNTNLQIRQTSAAGTQLQAARATSPAASASVESFTVIYVGTFAAVSTVIVGCANVNVTTGAPILARSATTVARLIVEDIGPS
jgi:hypothetical protein